MTRLVLVDETKRAGYVMVAVAVDDPPAVRHVLRGLILPGQRRLHMHSEQGRRRRAILSAVVSAGVETTVYDASRRYPTELAARAACLAAVVEDLAAGAGDVRLIIEGDDSLVHSDRQQLYQLVRRAAVADTVVYEHGKAHEEPLLALPDVVAWSWVRSGEWRRRLGPVVTAVRHLDL